MKDDKSAQIIDDIKWFMFNDNMNDTVNEYGFSHGLKFIKWNGDEKSFIVSDGNGDEYRISISKEGR